MALITVVLFLKKIKILINPIHGSFILFLRLDKGHVQNLRLTLTART